MENINTVTLCGNITRDSALSYTGGGTAVLKYSIAVNRSVKNGDSYTDEPSYIEIVQFGKAAEAVKQYLTKGTKICVNGSLRQDRWQSEGQNHSKVYVVANQVEFMTRNNSNNNQSNYNNQTYPGDDEIAF